MINLDELEAKARAATSGPWAWRRLSDQFELFGDGAKLVCAPEGGVLMFRRFSDNVMCIYPSPNHPDAAFIAAFNPAVALRLIELLRKAERVAEFYGDANEWIDFKAYGTDADGERRRVDSHFDRDEGKRAREFLTELRRGG